MNKLALLLVGVLSVPPVWCSTALNPGQVLEFPISKKGLTRISIENEGIEDIYAYPMEYADNITHHKSGHVFVVADDLQGPLYVTLITKRGVAQDLTLSPSSKKPEPIVLRFEDEALQQKEILEQSSTVLEKFIQGVIPTGFYRIDVEEVSRSRGAISCVVETAYQKAPYRVVIYTVKNETPETITLDNRLLWEEGDLAVAFDQPHLEANQTAKLYVIQKI
ncbi:MAG: type-F conjugative transfer system secretin TraK [Candidatus Paracaedibacteraceae bacterium]|nr:type-F conjugative transfer system secretin TraK [Candidatus Paracaedibacteraceae bacterium]